MKVDVSYSFDIPEDMLQEGIRKAVDKEIAKRTWIPVTERLPENQDPVIVSVPETKGFCAYIGMAYYTDSPRGGFWCGTDGNVYGAIGIITKPTHWMPLPDPPEKQQ